MEQLFEYLDNTCKQLSADGVKIYFQNKDNYTIKFIKAEKVIKKIKLGNANHFDITGYYEMKLKDAKNNL